MCCVGNQNFTAIPLVQAYYAWLYMYLILGLYFCDTILLWWYKMWLCILYIINAMLGTLFLMLIVEVKDHPMECLDTVSGWGKYSSNPLVTRR